MYTLQEGNNMEDDYTIFDRVDFIFEHVFWALVGYSWYKSLLFRCVDGLLLKTSRWILLGCIVGACVCGIIKDFEKVRVD